MKGQRGQKEKVQMDQTKECWGNAISPETSDPGLVSWFLSDLRPLSSVSSALQRQT